MARPEGTDGSDHEYRQVIHDRYKQRALAKKRIKTLTWLLVPAHILRLLLHCIPIFINVGDATTGSYYIAFAAILSFLIQLGGISTKPQPSHRALMLSNIIMALVLVADVMTFWLYHTMAPKRLLYPELVAKYFMRRKKWPKAMVRNVVATVEASVSLFAIGITGACVWITYSYVMDISGKRERMGSFNPRDAHSGAHSEAQPEEREGRKDK
uniref:Uncharacterized protein n=1 Tax=Tetraselmis sp. GSL018 TaxID=582737 RepID=A0A061SBP3_9CHLO